MSEKEKEMRITRFRGCIALCFHREATIVQDICKLMDASELNFERLPIEALHMTLITKEEMKSLSGEAKEAALQVSTRFFPIGLGKGSNKPNSNVFMMCVWPKAQMFRLKHGLAMKYFHITISRENDHTIVKGYDSLIDSALLISSLSMEANEALIRQLLLQKKNDLALIYATSLCENYGKETVRGWARLGEAAILNEKYKLAMLSYGHFYCISEHRAMKLLAIRKIIDCSSNTEWGRLFLESEIDEIPSELLPFLMKRWSATLKDEICKFITQSAPTQSFRFSLPSREKMYTALATSPLDPSYRLPRFFRWIVPFRLAAMSTPRNEEDIVHLKSSVGIDHIVTLTLEEPLPEQWFKDTNIKNTFMPVPNYAAPSMEQLDLFMELCLESGKNGSSVLVHCGGGKGRAGTIIACYLVAFGFNLPNVEDWQQPFMTANEAIDQLRSMRPGSIETIEQEQAVMKYCTRLWKRRSVLPKVIEEPPPSHPIIEGNSILDSDLLVLCGLPGSGKSWFREALLKRSSPGTWKFLSGDEHGAKACERGISQRHSSKLIMDRCNGDPTKRATLLSHASIWSKHPSAIWFDYEPELCISRAQKRLDHPTLPPGSRVRAAVSHHSSIFVPPSLKEGFHTVVRVTSLEASRDLVLSLSPCLGLVKFPRTPHLFNLGAVTADDIVKSPPSNCNDCQIMITEKIDGANMGFSLSSKGCIVAQNRSHYVNSKTHAQFKKLEHFIELNRESLYEILYIDPCFPERYTLYGEWMAATHSIHYDCLNSIFYAFDLYDRVSKTFLGRKALENKLQGTNIPIIPLLWSGTTLPSHEELITMVETTKSNFCMNGILEGIYLKWETTDGTGNVIVKYRCKLVRGDFITGNLHWTKGILRFNKIVQ